LREITQAEGHVVRAFYLYAGMADVAVATDDKSLIPPLEKAWNDMAPSRTFVTGSCGEVSPDECFSSPYQLPNEKSTVEGCAAVTFMFFAQRMSQLLADAKYMDEAERVLYNRLAGETSLDGQKFFYGCPLTVGGVKNFDGGGGPLDLHSYDNKINIVETFEKKTYRSPWFVCPCCPTNVVRFLPTIGGYVYGQNANTVFVNLYVGGTANLRLIHGVTWSHPVNKNQDGINLKLEQTGNYPWEGNVKIAVKPQKATRFDLALRVPSWCEGITFKVNGKPAVSKMDKGYARIARTWKTGDVVEINMPMPVKRVYADPRVEADKGRVVLQRGPIVYCLEGVDHNGKVLDIVLPKDAKLTAEKRPDLLGGVTVITGTAKRIRNGQTAEDVKITAIPFYTWDNRPPSGEMVVWIPENENLLTKEYKQ
jgi:uncharacterized protein